MSLKKTAACFLLCALIAVTGGCWIPLPEETAIVVEVFDAQGEPVDGVSFSLDSAKTIVTGSQINEGQVFESLTVAGNHTLQLEPSSLLDPQGGMGWAPLASKLSGEVLPLSFENRPFAGGSNLLVVPVNKGEITVVSIYLDDLLKSPADNQWLTDGFDNSNPYRMTHLDEFAAASQPTFWWKQDPSLGATVYFTFQLWEDDDGDTRYPLGIADHVQYAAVMNPANAAYRPPDWQVPLAGIQRAKAASTVNQVVLWSSVASDPNGPVKYDLYYAPASQWNSSDVENNPVLRDLVSDGNDGQAVRFRVGNGTPNDGLLLKNGVPYTLSLAARDAASTLDTAAVGTPRGKRSAVPRGSGNTLGVVSGLAVTDTTGGGTLSLQFNCTPAEALRVYVAPTSIFSTRPFDPRFLRDVITCSGSGMTHDLQYLVNGTAYSVGIEPFDASGNVGGASSVVSAAPGGSLADTVKPAFLATPEISVTRLGPGEVRLTIAAAADSTSPLLRRVSWAPDSWSVSEEAREHIDLDAPPASSVAETSIVLINIPSGVPYNYAVRAIDAYGNSVLADTQVSLAEADTTGPTWDSDNQAFFSTISHSQGSTVRPLGAWWRYEGFSLGQDPGSGEGEYVWRVIQENPETEIVRESKLGAFYAYPGYYYASTESGGLDMSLPGPGRPGGGPSGVVDHRNVFSFVESAIAGADIMDAPFDSNSSDPARYRQRTAAGFAASLAAGSDTVTQLAIFYNTDEDGVAVVFPESGGGYLGIMKVRVVNKQRPLPTAEPHLQAKDLRLSYFTDTNGLVAWPLPLFGGGIYYFGTLDEPDFEDPRW